MLIDLTLTITPERYSYIEQSGGREGHLGTHFDAMDKAFPLESFRTEAVLIDISGIQGREVEVADLEGKGIPRGGSVVFYTGHLESIGFETPAYWRRSAELSDDAVTYLIDAGVKIIGVDAAGAQKPKKHVAVDQRCADNGVFIIENIDNMAYLKNHAQDAFTLFTAPMKRTGLTGLPCRVVAEVR